MGHARATEPETATPISTSRPENKRSRLEKPFKPFTMRAALVVLLLAGFFLAGCREEPPRRSDGPGNILALDSGPFLKNESGVYKGIPYAAPPVGPLRWKPPQPASPWTEPRPFDEFGPVCPQPGYDGPVDEDCLFLNIWTPARREDEKLPVMVWIHGGAFTTGSGSDEIYNGEALSKKGVVVVTLNYRLGPLGFLAHPQLSEESPDQVSGNYGLLDQVAALGWVRRNIARFGGDPGKVTIFGESAGAASVCLLLVSPSAGGLFHAAIAQSPVIPGGVRPLRTEQIGVAPAETVGKRICALMGIPDGPGAADALRKAPRADIEEAAYKLKPELGVEILGLVCPPTVDGYIIPDHPVRLFQSGRFHKTPLIAGTTENESTVFLPLLISGRAGPDEFRKYVRSAFPKDSEKVLELVSPGGGGDAWRCFDRIYSAKWFGAWTDFIARSAAKQGHPVWLYRFGKKLPEAASDVILADSTDADISAERLGVPHGAELFYLFGFMEFLLGFGDEDREFSEKITAYWTSFAKGGNPNGGGLPEWPGYGAPGQRGHLELGAEIKSGAGLEPDLYPLIEKTWLDSVY